MFLYTDPGKTLKPAAALKNYRLQLHTEYFRAARTPGSAYTLLEAFDEVAPAKQRAATVEWIAFPRSAQASNAQIDQDRFGFQDEYVEWRVEKTGGQIRRVTFTTDFLAYYAALARLGLSTLVTGIKAVIPGANPVSAELFGPNFNAANAAEEARSRKFINFATSNPWINGQKGILCLAHQSSTLSALFALVDAAAVPKSNVPAGAICAQLGGNCVASRNSDPSIASAVQTVARGGNSLTLADPAGIAVSSLEGIWRRGNAVIDVNAAGGGGIWNVTRSGRRAELTVTPDLVLDDAPITSGAQVAAALRVKATVLVAADVDLPEWARLGQENAQRLIDVGGGNP